LRKGSKVFVSGKLATRKWQDKDGGDRYSTEIVLQGPGAILTMLDGPQQTGERKRGYDDPPAKQSDSRGGAWADADDDSDIPF
jgi:single-strand DNA-binding protein